MTPGHPIRWSRRALVWGGVYLAAALAPLALALTGTRPAGRGFWIEFGVALGFLGLATIGLQFALTARSRWIGRGLGLDDLMQVHRWAGLLAVGFVLAHPIVLIAVRPGYLAFFDPRENLARALALSAAILASLLLLALPLLRRRLGISYEGWRLSHALLAFLALFVGTAHVLMVGRHVAEPSKRALWIALTVAPLSFLAHARLVRPVLARRRPWVVVDVWRETERVWTLALEPQGQPGLTFAPGQFVWLALGRSPLSLQQHPFTVASSAERPERLELTIKELGDFSATVGAIAPGTRAYLEGPCGAFTLDGTGADSAVFVAGGIGITPMMSMLRTLRDRGDRRPLTLLYGSGTLDKAIFRSELEELERGLELRMILVLEEPPPDWRGERGYITGELLARHLDLCAPGAHYFVCGPTPMMDAVESALAARGVPADRLHAERFDIV